MVEMRSLPEYRPVDGLMVVRTPHGWFATPPLGRDPIPLPLDAVLGLVDASAGAAVSLDDELVERLVSAGGLVGGRAPATTRWSTATVAGPVVPVPAGSRVWPAGAIVGRVKAGCLLLEGPGGRQAPLDHLDLMLLDSTDGSAGVEGGSADVWVGRAQLRMAGQPPPAVELRTRLARLAEVGALRWYPDPVRADDTDPPRPRLHGVPGRARLRAAYRRWRPAHDRVGHDHADGRPGIVDLGTRPAPSRRPPAETTEQEIDLRSRLYIASPRVGPPGGGRVPVYSPFQPGIGPVLALGMLTAHARHTDGGALDRAYEIRRTEDPGSMLEDLAGRAGPAIVLCSNYLWSREHNLDLARRAVAVQPRTVFVHGGPHTPAYPDDCRRFFADHPDLVHVTVRGEGEHTLADILTALAADLPELDLARLDGIPGLSYRRPADGEVVTSPDRERTADLDLLPSPYLTGEFDHLRPEAFTGTVTFESNRGCPYGCTFCDWGSSTLSRIRKFSLERVAAEMRWAGQRGLESWVLADANVGIMSRDVQVIDEMVAVRRACGVPRYLGFNVAKNTTKHLTAIMDRLVAAGIAPHVSLALQSTDADTLTAIRRDNINTDHYVALGASFRRHGLPLQADLMLGLPGQTVDSFLHDIQFLMDHEIPARIWVTQLLPNSPMNEPSYRDEYRVEADADGLVVSSSTFSTEDRTDMKRLRHAHAVFDRFGLLRHVLRHLQWDHGIAMTAVLRRLVDVSHHDPHTYPLLTWSMRYFDHFGVPPFGWRSFYAEVRRFVVDEFDVPLAPALETVLTLQEFLMPTTGRRLPDTIVLDHDYLAYQRAATAGLWTTGHHVPPTRRLEDFGPARFTIHGDRLDRCGLGMRTYTGPRDDRVTDEFWMSGHMELDSPLLVNYADMTSTGRFLGLAEQLEHASTTAATADATAGPPAGPAGPGGTGAGVPVELGRARAVHLPTDR